VSTDSPASSAPLPLADVIEPTAEPVGDSVARAAVHGKFLGRGDRKLYVRGVTYGPFRPGRDGIPYDPDRTDEDFARMAAEGINAVRTYTTPPRWLLDTAARHGLLVLAGLAWEQHIAFLEDPARTDTIVTRLGEEVRSRAGHPALLAWVIGNEIPAPIVRFYGTDRVAAFLRRLYDAAKREDPGALVTYVSYPSTEYLELPWLDFVCFNVFLESRDRFDAYLARLQILADDRPLVLTEIGLDSGTHGEEAQAESIDWQVRAAFAGGCAGAFVFGWTDEWHRGGHDIEDWHFGVTTRDRRAKPALHALRAAFADVPVALGPAPPRISVVVCTYNGARTLRETCTALAALDYPDAEVIVVDDGSTDDSAAIATECGFRVISTENQGLSAARNVGMHAATGEFVAYVDDDTMPDPHWLTYLAAAFQSHDWVAVGGPNLPVSGDGPAADAVAAAPGNPSHVLYDDRSAEHIPGCNSAFRRDALMAIGGFDPRFRAAGDDVDVCWRLQTRGGQIGFAPAAMVWHHRRGTARGYLRQQRGYGRAEAMLERKWPERYSAGGHVTWRGRIYGPGETRPAAGRFRWRVYHGVWGTAPFQRLYAPPTADVSTIALMPEIYLAIACLALLVALGALWWPLLLLSPILVVAAAALGLRAATAAARARFPTPGLSAREVAVRRALTAALHLAQPLVRLEGRLRYGLTPWRRRSASQLAFPRARQLEHWSVDGLEPHSWLQIFEGGLVAHGGVVRRGSDFDAWDLEVRGGTLAGTRIWTAVEEHGAGRQLARVRCRATWSWTPTLLVTLLVCLAVAALVTGSQIAGAILLVMAAALGLRTLHEAASAMGVTVRALTPSDPERMAERTRAF
jgi:GT2 family glycosyltransferase